MPATCLIYRFSPFCFDSLFGKIKALENSYNLSFSVHAMLNWAQSLSDDDKRDVYWKHSTWIPLPTPHFLISHFCLMLKTTEAGENDQREREEKLVGNQKRRERERERERDVTVSLWRVEREWARGEREREREIKSCDCSYMYDAWMEEESRLVFSLIEWCRRGRFSCRAHGTYVVFILYPYATPTMATM